jgi:hypothetical protein
MVAIGNLFWNIHFQRNADRMECGNFLNAPSFPSKQLKLASAKLWLQAGSRPLVERPLSFNCLGIETETTNHSDGTFAGRPVF